MNTITAVTNALRFLAGRTDYEELKEDIMRLAETRHGALGGELSRLNPLIDLAREHPPQAMEGIWTLADRGHARAFGYTGAPEIGPRSTPPRRAGETSNPAVYRRRRLLGKAAKLWFRLTGERIVGIDRARRDAVEGEIWAMWMSWREELLQGAGSDRVEIIRLFWADIDSRLDQGLAGDTDVARQVLGLTR